MVRRGGFMEQLGHQVWTDKVGFLRNDRYLTGYHKYSWCDTSSVSRNRSLKRVFEVDQTVAQRKVGCLGRLLTY